ncbi:ROK family protein [Muribacter muris]|uniref:ROK family protein n=1 Tax=Muribacter muris TaxID=67855 RepID=A0A4Y9JYT1_9PAST|nr:ROK family protein [Muribacter muris]MBF0785466.1 ROK family protein [Muribacter muris]MBF0828114.1 ROK family protein [Muribacter muris]TFV09596.1 ROK family protein [Muribacter muris]
MKTSSNEYKYQHLGKVFRLVEQFELISRTDLAKLSGFAPASMTMLTKTLIEHKFILERASQNLPSRGRPAVGLSVSPFYWHFVCLTISSNKLAISLCELNGQAVQQADYTVDKAEYPHLAEAIFARLQHFMANHPLDQAQILAVSVSVLGKINAEKTAITQLGQHSVQCPLATSLAEMFHCPILLNEHFQLWFLAESTLGSLISNDNVIFLQLDDTINLSVLLKGKLLHQDEHKRMNVDKMIMPKFSPLSEEIAAEMDEMQRFQLANQVTLPALTRLIDRYLPNTQEGVSPKIQWFCQCVERQNPHALAILEHLSDNLAYMLMNLINIFSTEKIMLNSPLLHIKTPLFERVQAKLGQNLLRHDLNIDLVTSQYDWNSPLIPAVAIKLGIYKGNLLKNLIEFK